MYGMRGRRQAVSAALERLGLAARQDQLAGALSGGWKQRLALAACMLHTPRLLLLDEPTAGVDPKARREFWAELHALAAEGIAVLVSTHYMDEAERCHRLAYIFNGTLLTTGTAEEVIAGQGLDTWTVSGPDLAALEARVRDLPGVDQVAPFGTTLHITGRDGSLETAFDDLRADGRWRIERTPPSLEDVFIHLMSEAADNHAGRQPR
jgi:ABC-2 type transport system ATP-binding protein